MSQKKLGSLRKSEKGSLYIKIDEGVSLDAGAVIQLQDPRKKLDESVEKGRLSQERADEIRAKIPDYIRYELVLAPPKK